ncbi:MAG: hypothetical protein ACHQ4H_15065 [Ktedonobacterales bacterium]
MGVLILFISLALQWLVTLRLRHADSVAQVREWSSFARGINRLAPISAVLILGAGIYMTVTAWSLLTTWVDVSIAAMVIMMIFGLGVAGRRLKAIQCAAAEASAIDAIPATLQARLDDPTLWVSMQMAVTVALGIVFMMTTKPSLTISIVAVLVALVLGALVGRLTLRPRRAAPVSTIALPMNQASTR